MEGEKMTEKRNYRTYLKNKEEKADKTEEPVVEAKEEPKKKKAPAKKKEKFGIVVAKRALNVRTTPVVEEKNVLCTFTRGTKVKINEDVETPEGWYNVVAERSGVTVCGYVMAEFINLI